MPPTKILAVIVCVLVFIMGADSVDFSDCGSDYKIKTVEIEGCSSLPCHLEIGRSYGINMTIKPTYITDSMTQEAFVKLYEVNMKVSVTPDNPCASLPCPVQITDITKFSGVIHIGKNLVPAKAELWWKMKADYNRQAVCMKTSVLLVRPQNAFNILKLHTSSYT